MKISITRDSNRMTARFMTAEGEKEIGAELREVTPEIIAEAEKELKEAAIILVGLDIPLPNPPTEETKEQFRKDYEAYLAKRREHVSDMLGMMEGA
jgi:hypothetical protein